MDQLSDLALKILQAAGVLDDIVCKPPFLIEAHLGFEMAVDFLLGQAVALAKPLSLRLAIARDENHRAKPGVDLGLEQEGSHIDDKRRAGFGELVNPLSRQAPNLGMRDRLELLACLRIVENNRAQFLPIDGLIRSKNLGAESFADRAPRRLSGTHDLARQDIGVDHARAEPFEHRGHGTLTARDSSGKTHEFHFFLIAESSAACNLSCRHGGAI